MATILVLGARHLGGAIADRYAAEGWNVATVSQSEETASLVRERLPDALALTADVSVAGELQGAVDEVLERFGSIELAVNAISAGMPEGVPFGGGPLLEAPAEAIEPYTETLIPAVFHFFRICGRAMAEDGTGGTLVQVTGGSARRAMPGKGAWAAGAHATRALAETAAQELRKESVHAALLVVDAVIESEKSRDWLAEKPDDFSTTHEDVVDAVAYLEGQTPRAWSHELTITPRGDRWVP